MKQYDARYGTPLKFHKFLWYFSLPVGFIMTLGQMYNIYLEMKTFNWLYAVDYSYFSADLLLMLVCFIGFFKWKPYAWYSINAFLSLGILYNIYTVIVYATYIPSQTATALGRLIGILIYSILVGIYYMKRKFLFIMDEYKSHDHLDVINGSTNNNFSAIQKRSHELSQIGLCQRCGFEMIESSDFCSHCGMVVIKKST